VLWCLRGLVAFGRVLMDNQFFSADPFPFINTTFELWCVSRTMFTRHELTFSFKHSRVGRQRLKLLRESLCRRKLRGVDRWVLG
jgi:hypothetical protein